jgi:glycosyltransferase involved in cell wall biosynthesis
MLEAPVKNRAPEEEKGAAIEAPIDVPAATPPAGLAAPLELVQNTNALRGGGRGGRAAKPYISMVVPIFNEVENVEPMVAEIVAALDPIGKPFEIIAVDDGSTDGSFAALKAICAREPRLRVIRFRRNFGQTPAFTAGFDRARGTWVITIDADLQNDPADIPAMLKKAEEGFDIVSGWRVKRQDALIARKIPSRIANWLVGKVTGVSIHDYGCSLKVYHREVAKNVKLYGELHRFVPAVAASLGTLIAEMPVNHRARTAGESKYTGLLRTLTRTAKVLLDLLTVRFLMSYSTRPIHIFGSLGVATAVLGVAIGLYLTYAKLVLGEQLHDRPLLMLAVLLVMVGVQFITLGLLGELVVRTYHESQKKPTYSVREALNEPPKRRRSRTAARRAQGSK